MSAVPNPIPIDRKLIANGFAEHWKDSLPESQIEAITHGLMAESETKSAILSIISVIFYYRFKVEVTRGKTFVGNAGGFGSAGGGLMNGDMYCDDFDRLYKYTVSFSFEATPVYVSLQFFDSNSNLLGHFQGGGASSVIGAGGGSGGWS